MDKEQNIKAKVKIVATGREALISFPIHARARDIIPALLGLYVPLVVKVKSAVRWELVTETENRLVVFAADDCPGEYVRDNPDATLLLVREGVEGR